MQSYSQVQSGASDIRRVLLALERESADRPRGETQWGEKFLTKAHRQSNWCLLQLVNFIAHVSPQVSQRTYLPTRLQCECE